MSVDPVSAGIKIGAMALSTALTASQVIEGPRLKDLGVSVSEFGTPLMDVYGTAKVDGCPYIHAEKLREKKVQSKTKGGKYNEYKYFFTGEAAICGHPIEGVAKIWFDGKLVYDATRAGPSSIILGIFTGLSDAPVKLAQGRNFRLRLGDEAQMPDPRYEEWCEDRYGPDSAPAGRGKATMFLEEIPLEKLGNRPPTISALPVRNLTPAYLSDTVDAGGLPIFSPDFMRFYLDEAIWDTATLQRISSAPHSPEAWLSSGSYWDLAGSFPVGPSINLYTADGHFSAAGPTSPIGADDVIAIDGEIFLRPYGAILNKMIRLNGSSFDVTDIDFAPTAGIQDASGEAYLLGRKFGGSNGIAVLGLSGFYEGAVSPVIPTSSTETAYGWLNDDVEWVLIQGSSVFRVDPETLSVLQTETGLPVGVTSISKGPGGRSFWCVSGSLATEVSMLDLSVMRTVDLTLWGGSGIGGVYDPVNHAIVQSTLGNTRWLYLDKIDPGSVNLSDVLASECLLAGITDTLFEGDDPTIDGWAVAPGPVADRISPLLDLHDLDAGAHDFGIRFKVRGSAADGVIDSSEFVRDGEIRWQAPQVQDVQMPKRLSFTYADGSKDHKINSATFQRPISVTDSNREQQMDMSTYVSTPAEAQPLVDRFGRRKWMERETIEFGLMLRHAALEVNDVKQVMLDGQPRTARLVELTRSGLSLRTKWVRDDPRVHDPNASVGPALDGRDDEELYISGPAKAYVLDIPLLQDAENTTNVLLHFGVGPYSTLHNFPGATIYQLDPVENEYASWEDVESGQRGIWGYATEALAGASPAVWDRRNSLNIRLKGELVSRTMAEIEADPTINLIYVGREDGEGELLNFADAVAEVDGTTTISTLRRGRRGTEWAIDDHSSADLCVLCSTLLTETLGLDTIGDVITFKGQSFGRTLDGAYAFDVPIEARALKPYAPARFRAWRDAATGDWHFDWIRRTRVGGNWRTSGAIPLSEASEAYKLRILDSDGDVVRTIDVASPGATWTSAQQTTDFGGAQSEVRATVCQVADAVEGFEASVERGAAPTVVGSGALAQTNSLGSGIVPSLHASTEAGDLMFLACETDGSDVIAAPSGWEAVPNSPQAGAHSKLHLFWKRAGYSESSPTVVRTGDHLMGRIISIRGALPRGNPFDATAGGTSSTSSMSIPGLTTTIDNCLILDFASTDADTNSAVFSGWTNADLTSLSERFDEAADAGGGGGVACNSGLRAVAGSIGATTVTVGAGSLGNGCIKVAIRPA